VARSLFTEPELAKIRESIAQAELHTSGEIRVHIERLCKEDVLDHAAFIFKELKMHQTAERNGVLFYISYEDHKLAIIGDKGIHEKVKDEFWQKLGDYLIAEFKSGNYTSALTEAIRLSGAELKKHFPYTKDDVNELSNDISFGSSN
jgi:uncharacterized membrane protein